MTEIVRAVAQEALNNAAVERTARAMRAGVSAPQFREVIGLDAATPTQQAKPAGESLIRRWGPTVITAALAALTGGGAVAVAPAIMAALTSQPRTAEVEPAPAPATMDLLRWLDERGKAGTAHGGE